MTKRIFADLASHTAPAMVNLLKLIPEQAWDVPVSQEGFGPRELVCHVADNEQVALDWVHLAVREPGAKIEVPDALEMAKKGDYLSADPWTAIERFTNLRKQVCDFVVTLSDEELDRHMSCPFRGAVTVHDQCIFLLGHDVFHLELLSRAALGKLT